MFWKTRWENSFDGSSTPYRTLVSYKDTHFDKPEDPAGPGVTTGTWRDPRFSPPGDAGKPENNLTGQLFLVNSGTSEIHVPGSFSKLRFWRNTEVSKLTPAQTLTLAPGTGTLGYEWDVDPDNGFRPTGRFSLSSTTVSGVETFTDYGTAVEQPTTATHSLSLYKAPSGALVFGAGTVQWSWGLDVTNAWHKSGPDGFEPDPTMQQATVNLMADMGAQPATLQSNLVATSKSTDATAPSATVGSPSNGAGLTDGKAVTISGTASDAGGGVVAGVEVSTDGGSTWHPASGTTSWTYSWIAHGSPSTTIKARAIDDSGNIGAASSGTTVSVACPCSIFGATVPATADSGDTGSVELGMKFRSETAGTIDGVRFYKSAANTGTHVGGLWTEGGTLLAEGNFSGETATGWQQMKFANPVPIQANTTYVAGYLAPKGHYSASPWTINHPPAVGPDILDSPPLHVVADSVSENGLYEYTSGSSFPTNSFQATNYWVDVLFTPAPIEAIPGQPDRCQRQCRSRLGDGVVVAADERRYADLLSDHPPHRRRRPDAGHCQRPRELENDRRPDPRHGLYLHGRRDQRRRRRPGLGGLQLGDADRGNRARSPDRRQRQRWPRPGDGQLDRPGQQRRQSRSPATASPP